MSLRFPSQLVASQPQYVLVAQRLIGDIASGRYPVGSLLPAELALCTQLGVSRHTIREAIRRLQERGLVRRQRGVGTSEGEPHGDPLYQSTNRFPTCRHVRTRARDHGGRGRHRRAARRDPRPPW